MTIHAIHDSERLVSLQEAVDLGYGGYSTLRRYCFNGTLDAVRVGRRIRIKLSDLEALGEPLAADQDGGSSTPASPNMVDQSVIEWAQRMAATAPPMTDEQAAKIVAILRGGGSA